MISSRKSRRQDKVSGLSSVKMSTSGVINNKRKNRPSTSCAWLFFYFRSEVIDKAEDKSSVLSTGYGLQEDASPYGQNFFL